MPIEATARSPGIAARARQHPRRPPEPGEAATEGRRLAPVEGQVGHKESARKRPARKAPEAPKAPGVGRAGASRPSDQELLARAIAAEARGEPYEARVAVGAAIVNYAKRTGKSLAKVIRSAFLASNFDRNRRFYEMPMGRIPDWNEHWKAAGEALGGKSPIGERPHFVDDRIGPPGWVDPRSGKQIGRMIFYNPRSGGEDFWQRYLPESMSDPKGLA